MAVGEAGVRDGGVYLIVGGMGGIGLALAEHWLARRGARVVLAGRREADAAMRGRVAEWARAGGGEAMFARVDAAEKPSLRERIARIQDEVRALGEPDPDFDMKEFTDEGWDGL